MGYNKNLAEHSLKAQKNLDDEIEFLFEKLSTIVDERERDDLEKKIMGMAKHRYDSLAQEVFAKFAHLRTGYIFDEYSEYRNNTLQEHENAGRFNVELMSEKEYLLHWGNLLKNAEFEHERIKTK